MYAANKARDDMASGARLNCSRIYIAVPRPYGGPKAFLGQLRREQSLGENYGISVVRSRFTLFLGRPETVAVPKAVQKGRI